MAELDSELIGKVFESSTPVTISGAMIEGFCKSIGVPVEHDTDGTIIAPLSISGSIRAAEDIFDYLPQNQRRLLGSMELDFVKRIRAGDQLHVSSQVAEVYEKTGRSGGLIFTVIRTVLTNQSGEVVTRIDHRFTHRKAVAKAE
ncbi:MAG TPA: MaoC family dehydratase N-terminal domain-containing protein [Candidatus Binataceae bacterium]|nr:MaoC family dehydratase N-terminal domain-containing protein [Candidatus Binataceae bacterium]